MNTTQLHVRIVKGGLINMTDTIGNDQMWI